MDPPFSRRYERGCDEMTAVLETAAGGNASAWLEQAVAPPGGCRVCYVRRPRV